MSECKHCGAPIVWRQRYTGDWLPIEPDERQSKKVFFAAGDRVHKCGLNSDDGSNIEND